MNSRRLPILPLTTFALGILLTWFWLRTNPLASPLALTEASAASTPAVTATRVASTADAASASSSSSAKPLQLRDVVTLSENSRNGRIQTTPIRSTTVPQTGALPGKLVVDENRTARLAAPVTGRVLKLFKEPGDAVSAGEVLALIDAPELSTVQAEARKALVEVGLKSSAAQRMAELHTAGAVALKELQAAQAEATEAQGELQRTQTRLRQLNSLGRNDGIYKLISPLAGTITERSVTLGQQVRAEEALNLFVVSDLHRLNLVLDVPETQASRFAIAQKLQVLIDGAGGDAREAAIIRIGPAVDPSTRRVQVRAAIANGNASLRPEMYVRAFGTDAQQRTALELPISALTARGSESAIFIERQAGNYERVAVEILTQHPERAWVKVLADKVVANDSRVVSQGALLLDSEIASR